MQYPPCCTAYAACALHDVCTPLTRQPVHAHFKALCVAQNIVTVLELRQPYNTEQKYTYCNCIVIARAIITKFKQKLVVHLGCDIQTDRISFANLQCSDSLRRSTAQWFAAAIYSAVIRCADLQRSDSLWRSTAQWFAAAIYSAVIRRADLQRSDSLRPSLCSDHMEMAARWWPLLYTVRYTTPAGGDGDT